MAEEVKNQEIEITAVIPDVKRELFFLMKEEMQGDNKVLTLVTASDQLTLEWQPIR